MLSASIPDDYEPVLSEKEISFSTIDTIDLENSARNSSQLFHRNTSSLPIYAKECKFEWQNICVSVNNKQILHSLSGSVESGQLLAVMGGSGAGKSTLIDALSGRTQQKVSGYLAINGRKFKCSQRTIIKQLCTFVAQTDVLCATQTVEECLSFYAKLKLSYLSQEKQQKRINHLIQVLHLEKCQNNLIGSESKRGISGGEKRRVSIASEILSDADIIFLDEPTSGLDAYTAARTIKTLKQFCSVSNKIIIATIHQPSVEVFYLFDKLLLLAQGKCCFNSSIGQIETFYQNVLRPRTNPIDVIVFEAQRNPNNYAEKWKNAEINPFDKDTFNLSVYDEFKLSDLEQMRTNNQMSSKCLQYRLLLTREIMALWREPRDTFNRLAQVIFFALTSGFIFFQIKPDFVAKIGCLFFLSVIPLLFGIVSLLTVFPKQKLLFEREFNSNTYDIVPWALSFMIIEIPREIIHMFIFTLITHFMIGLHGNFMMYWVTMTLAALSGGSCAILIGVLSKSMDSATQSVPAALIPLLIFSDALVPLRGFPKAIKWIANIDPLYYITRCFWILEFDGAKYPKNMQKLHNQLCTGLYHKDVKIFTNAAVEVAADYGLDINQEILDEICSKTISYKHFFNRKKLESGWLLRYWIFVLIICFVIRLLSLCILLFKNKNGYDWIRKKLSTAFCTFCTSSRM